MLARRRFSRNLIPWLGGLVLFAGCLAAEAADYYVSLSGHDGNAGSPAAAWRTLQKAAATLQPGDRVSIEDGVYPGGVIHRTPGRRDAPIVYKALGRAAVVDGSGIQNRDAFFIDQAHYVTLDGIQVRNAQRAGVRVSLADHVQIRNGVFADNRVWGIFSDYANDLVIEGNEVYGSKTQHGIYVSNSGDRPIIRRNNIHDNAQAGIQINADPALLRLELGESGDGITTGAIVERNVIYDNGEKGAAGINLASVRYSRIVNNLLYHNLAGGIAGWGDGNGPEWGCQENLFAHNTIVFRPGRGRFAISLKEGSTGNLAVNNILVEGAGGLEFDSTSGPPKSDHNLFFMSARQYVVQNATSGVRYTLQAWQRSGHDVHSIAADPRFVAPIIGNFRLLSDSPARTAGAVFPDVPADLDGVPRPRNSQPDLGAYQQPLER